MGEALVTGTVGGGLGVLLGLAGCALISASAPILTAVVPPPGASPTQATASGGALIGGHPEGVTASHTFFVHLTAPVGLGVVILALALAMAGGLIAGSVGGWRIARLRPTAALVKLE